jgi:hypothetical protein
LVVALLRRIAYTLLALFRSVTQRSGPAFALPEAHPEPAPAPETEPAPGAALAQGLFYRSRLR